MQRNVRHASPRCNGACGDALAAAGHAESPAALQGSELTSVGAAKCQCTGSTIRRERRELSSTREALLARARALGARQARWFRSPCSQRSYCRWRIDGICGRDFIPCYASCVCASAQGGVRAVRLRFNPGRMFARDAARAIPAAHGGTAPSRDRGGRRCKGCSHCRSRHPLPEAEAARASDRTSARRGASWRTIIESPPKRMGRTVSGASKTCEYGIGDAPPMRRNLDFKPSPAGGRRRAHRAAVRMRAVRQVARMA